MSAQSGTKRNTPLLPCPQCGELTPSDSRYCSACGAEMYAECPDCGTRRSAEDAFCRKCGFDFSRKKLRLKDAPSVAEAAPENPLPLVQFHKRDKRNEYRMSPLMGTLRAIFMLVFLLLIAAAVFWGAYWVWENVTLKDLQEMYRRGPSAVFQRVASKKAVEPDWNARYQYWVGYYRDVFTPPPTNTWVEICLATGVRKKGVLVQITDEHVMLKINGQDLGFPKVLLDGASRQVFFADDFASAGARARVEEEKKEWVKQADQKETRVETPSDTAASPSAGGLPAGALAVRSFVDIKCPVCGGLGYCIGAGSRMSREVNEGRLTRASGKTLDNPGEQRMANESSTTLSRTDKEPCPVCGARGFRRFDKAPDFPWLAGASRCSQCQGMGMISSRANQGFKSGGISASVCPTCNHQGYVVNQWDAAHNVPPRYE